MWTEVIKVSWDSLFMSMVYLIAMKSKDVSTHVGAVVVDDNHIVRSMGYNGLPRGINDNISIRQERPEKYFWYEHAERNAIYNRTLPLDGCTMYTNGAPCSDCVRAIIQSGIKEVVIDKKWDNDTKWSESCDVGNVMFNEANVRVRFWDGDILSINKFRSGEVIK